MNIRNQQGKPNQMNKICTEYIASVKSFFPVIQKEERGYLASLKTEVEDFCLENDIQSLEGLYENYKYPSEVVQEYYALTDPAGIIRQIQIRKWLRGAAAVLLALAVTASVLYGIKRIKEEQSFRETDRVFEEYHKQQELLNTTENE